MTEKSNRLTLYVPRDLTDEISRAAAQRGLSLSSLTRELYGRYLTDLHDDPTAAQPETEAEFFSRVGRQFYRLAAGAVTVRESMTNGTKEEHGEEISV